MPYFFRFLLMLCAFLFISTESQSDYSASKNFLSVPLREQVIKKTYASQEWNEAACYKEEQIVKVLNRHYYEHQFEGGVLVNYKGELLHVGYYGFEDRKTRKKIDRNSVFQLASLSKQFTAMSIMILQDAGKLNFDDEVRKYIPNWPYRKMTIRHLLNHTAGLPNYMWLTENNWKKERAPYNHEVVAMLVRNKHHLNNIPGTKFVYSNTSYVVLAYLAEKISGKPFDEFLKEAIFDPLGMKNTFAYSTSFNLPREKISGYRKAWRKYKEIPETINDGCIGDKGIYSTLDDLYIWDQAIYTDKLVPLKLIEEATTKSKTIHNREVPYGMGVRIKNKGNQNVAYHYGKWNGFRPGFLRYVDDLSTIIVLNHTNYPYVHQLSEQIENILFEEEVN